MENKLITDGAAVTQSSLSVTNGVLTWVHIWY